MIRQLVYCAAAALISVSHGQYQGTGPSQFVTDILKRHNTYRSQNSVVPASNMQELTWDQNLANTAYRQARTCKWGHPSGTSYGQNIYKGRRKPNEAVAGAMRGWCTNEIGRHSRTMKSEYARGMTNIASRQPYDHVSQVLWATTRKVGCGYATCQGQIYLVCNYFPPGNYRGRPWFLAGKQCSRCDRGQTCVNGLCRTGSGAGTGAAISKPKPTRPVPVPSPTKVKIPFPEATKVKEIPEETIKESVTVDEKVGTDDDDSAKQKILMPIDIGANSTTTGSSNPITISTTSVLIAITLTFL